MMKGKKITENEEWGQTDAEIEGFCCEQGSEAEEDAASGRQVCV